MAGALNEKELQQHQTSQPAPQAAVPVAEAPAAAAAAASATGAGTNAALKGVSEGTAGKLNQYSQGYRQSGGVQAAQDYLSGVLGNKPVADAQLSQLYDRIMNREKFSYDLNGDALYQQYKDQYQSLGRQAMADTMGNATALTGGYGNSYAATVGNQAYQRYLQQLNDIVPELYQQAYNRYTQEGADLLNQYNLAYGQYRDTVGDWENERNYANSDYWQKYNADYSDYQNMLNYWSQMAQQENANYYTDRDYAYNLAMAIIKNKKMPSDDILAAAGMTQADAKQLGARVSSGGSGGSKKSSGSSGGASSGSNGLSYADLVNYKNNQNYREQMTGSKTYSAATMDKAISAAEKAGTITSSQASALRKSASGRR